MQTISVGAVERISSMLCIELEAWISARDASIPQISGVEFSSENDFDTAALKNRAVRFGMHNLGLYGKGE